MRTREEATLELAQEILADPEKTMRVVVAAIVAEHDTRHEALSKALAEDVEAREARVNQFFADQEASNRARAELGLD